MRILLVGGLGFIGRNLIRKICPPHSLVVFSDPQAASNSAAFLTRHQTKLEIGDVVDGARLSALSLQYLPESFVHLAALTGIDKCAKYPSLAFSVNVLGTYNVIMACLASKSKLIFISSREVYGETISDLTTEDDPLSPNNLYGMTKLLGENLVKWAASKYDLDYTILRLTNVYGPGGDQYGIQIMIKKALAQEEILVLGGKQTVNLLYVDDAVEAIRLCLLDSRSSRQAFNVGSFDNITLDAALSEIASLFGDTLKLRHKPMRDGETFRFAPSLEKIEKTLGYRPATGLTMGLENTVRWYRKHAAIRASV